MVKRPQHILLLTGLLLNSAASISVADDWPQWMGPSRDGTYSEKGLIERFPEAGLKVKWRSPLGGGYAGPAVVGNRVFVMDFIKDNNPPPEKGRGRHGKERTLCLDAATGKELWQHSYDRTYKMGYDCGPRCTPTVVGDAVFALGAEGDLWALELTTGKVRWHVNFADKFQAKTPAWGFAAHPLVDGNRVVCMVGGKDSTVVAFDTKTGEVVWKSLSARGVGYCPPVILERDNQRQILVWHAEALCGLDPTDGRCHWQIPLETYSGMAICRPQISGNRMFVSGVQRTAVMFELGEGVTKPKELWRGKPKTTALYGAANSTPLFIDDMVYGSCAVRGSLIAFDAATGERLWESFKASMAKERPRDYGTAFIVRAGGDRYFIFNETGDLIMARMNRGGYNELGRSHLLKPTGRHLGPIVWSHPGYAGRHCFARNDEEIICVSLAAEDY